MPTKESLKLNSRHPWSYRNFERTVLNKEVLCYCMSGVKKAGIMQQGVNEQRDQVTYHLDGSWCGVDTEHKISAFISFSLRFAWPNFLSSGRHWSHLRDTISVSNITTISGCKHPTKVYSQHYVSTLVWVPNGPFDLPIYLHISRKPAHLHSNLRLLAYLNGCR